LEEDRHSEGAVPSDTPGFSSDPDGPAADANWQGYEC
jgi:hypothetical protein